MPASKRKAIAWKSVSESGNL